MSVTRQGAALAAGVLLASLAVAAAESVKQATYATPEEASKAIVAAADPYDLAALEKVLGTDGIDLVRTEDPVQDKKQSADFAALAREKSTIVRDPGNPKLATIVVGMDDWPMPIPLVQKGDVWKFDTKTGRRELRFRRVGRNELDAIEVCRGYAEVQLEYASTRHDGQAIHQYAQRIISTPGKQDGLAWQAADGTWQGPIGEKIARVIAEGYTDKLTPYHGYYFKVLKKQGKSAPFGALDYVVNGAMIGGFALVAAPAEHGVTGVKTFLVGPDGVVYEKDLGGKTVEKFRALTEYDPDKSWDPVDEP